MHFEQFREHAEIVKFSVFYISLNEFKNHSPNNLSAQGKFWEHILNRKSND